MIGSNYFLINLMTHIGCQWAFKFMVSYCLKNAPDNHQMHRCKSRFLFLLYRVDDEMVDKIEHSDINKE